MACQMMRVISSPSSSTTVPSTLIFDKGRSPWDLVGLLEKRGSLGGVRHAACQLTGSAEYLDIERITRLPAAPSERLGCLPWLNCDSKN
jgi:hypothetical protein